VWIELFEDFDATHFRHRQIQSNKVRLQSLDCVRASMPSLGLAHNVKALQFQEGFGDQRPREGDVIHNDDAKLAYRSRLGFHRDKSAGA
jgi:hypothetical protein